jgi:carboxypeptidase family protein/TonB-dependent receptor-like protein
VLRSTAILTAFVAVAMLGFVASPAQAQSARLLAASTVEATHVSRGRVTGSVSDERGGPLPGAMVSMLGVTMATTVADESGHFSLDALPAGEYILRAHMSGFAASPRQLVRVGVSPTVFRLQLRRLDGTVGTTGAGPVEARPIVAAGFGLPAGPQPDAADDSDEGTDHPHGETAWRLRHIKRSILKDRDNAVILAENEAPLPEASVFSRAYNSTGFASSVFGGLPFSGEVNLLTSSSVGPGDLFSTVGLPRGIAYFSLGAPTPGGEWTVRAAMSEGELSSWIVAGAFSSQPGAHSYDFGVSYSTQEYQGRNPAALAAVTDGSRNVGELYGLGRWAIAPRLNVEYGARYAHYDYLEAPALFSPRMSVTVEPVRDLYVRATIAQRSLAPGAEEFLSPRDTGPWLPPERTFAPLSGPNGPVDSFSVERARSFDLTVEREFEGGYIFGVRRFYQSVDDQLLTLFGLEMPQEPRSVGHYYVASAGAVDADGWALRVSTLSTGRVRGSLEYSRTTAHWRAPGDVAAIGAWAPSTVRKANDELHDVTTSIETDIPETATRVFVVYKLNTGYARGFDDLGSGLDSRFDLQVNQALPVSVAGTKWELLVGLRNLFRDPAEAGSVYDELLVVRPPTRVVGGVLVKC